jgi:hypothetical protein
MEREQKLYRPRNFHSPELDQFTRTLRQYIMKVKRALRDTGIADEKHQHALVGKVCERISENSPRAVNLDGALAVVFTLATNMEKARLTVGHLQPLNATGRITSFYNLGTIKPTVSEKLAELEILGDIADDAGVKFWIPAAAQAVRLSNCHIHSIHVGDTFLPVRLTQIGGPKRKYLSL